MLLPTSSSSHSHSHSCSYTTRTLYPMVDSPSSCGLCYVDCRVCVIRVSRWLDIYIYFLIFIYIIFQLLFLLYFTLLWCISLHSKYLCIYPFRFAIGFDNILTPFYCIFLSLWGKYAISLVPIFLYSYIPKFLLYCVGGFPNWFWDFLSHLYPHSYNVFGILEAAKCRVSNLMGCWGLRWNGNYPTT